MNEKLGQNHKNVLSNVPIIRRPFVTEHRITQSVTKGLPGPAYSWTLRFWIETDPEHNGLTRESAVTAVENSVKKVVEWTDAYAICGILILTLISANSVEVCDPSGNGVAMHRDWP